MFIEFPYKTKIFCVFKTGNAKIPSETGRWFKILERTECVKYLLVMKLGMNIITYLNVLMYVYQIQRQCIYQIFHIKSK